MKMDKVAGSGYDESTHLNMSKAYYEIHKTKL